MSHEYNDEIEIIQMLNEEYQSDDVDNLTTEEWHEILEKMCEYVENLDKLLEVEVSVKK